MKHGIEEVVVKLSNGNEVTIDEIWASSIGLGDIFHDDEEVTPLRLTLVIRDTKEIRDQIGAALGVKNTSGTWEYDDMGNLDYFEFVGDDEIDANT